MFIFFAGSLLFNEQFGDVSNLFAEILKKKTRDNLIAFNCCNLSGSL